MASELGIKELRGLTSRRLRDLDAGDEIIVTDRGEPIAILRPVGVLSPAAQLLADLRSEPPGDSGAMEELMKSKARSISAQRSRR